jgi:hypothetical protein
MSQDAITHTRQVRSQFKSDEQAILFFTGMNLEALTDYKMDAGKEWISKYLLMHHFGKDEIEELWKEAVLLQWWNLQWRKMDHYIILPILHKVMAQEREAVYKQMHNDVYLSTHPNYKLLELALINVLARLQKEAA